MLDMFVFPEREHTAWWSAETCSVCLQRVKKKLHVDEEIGTRIQIFTAKRDAAIW
jgi:hypothetical protein